MDNAQTYYIFSDESGYFDKNNFYLRSSFMILAKEYQELTRDFLSLKDQFNIPRNKEFKYHFLYQVKQYQEKGVNKMSKDVEYFKDIPYASLMDFVRSSIRLLSKYDVQIHNIFTKFVLKRFKTQEDIETDFMKVLLSQIEMDLQNKTTPSFGVVFYDDTEIRDTLCKAYNQIFMEAKFIEKYSQIKDSLSFDISTYSTGIQLVDYIVGTIHSFLRGYKEGTEIFHEDISPRLRRKKGYTLDKVGFIPRYLAGAPFLEEVSNEIFTRIENKS